MDGVHQKPRLNLYAGVVLRDAAARVKTKKLPGIVSGSIITSVLDVKTGSVNGTLTPGRNIKLTGNKLKIEGTDPSVGLVFIPAAGGAPIPVDKSDIVVNHPGEIIAVIPNLAPGTYQVRLTTQHTGGGTFLKTPSYGAL